MLSPVWQKCVKRLLRNLARNRRRPRPAAPPCWHRPQLERLEDRTVPAIQLAYGATGTALTLSDLIGTQDNITISELPGNMLRIDVNGAIFDPGSSTTNVTYNNGTPGNSSIATIDISTTNAITTLTANLGAMDDALSLALTNANGGVGNVSIDAGAGADAVSLGAVTLGSATAAGNLAVTAETINVNGEVTAAGDVALTSTGVGGVTVNAAIDPASVSLSSADDVVINVALTATDLIRVTAGTDGTGSVVVNSTGSLSQTTAGKTGIQLSAGSTTGDITLQGTVSAADTLTMTAPAPSSTINFESSVVASNAIGSANTIIIGSPSSPGTIDTTAAASPTGAVSLTATRNIQVNFGASITTSAGAITLSANQQATPTSGTFDGIEINHATITSATGAILLQGKGGDTGSNNHGIVLEGGTVVSSTGTGAGAATITLVGSSGGGTSANLGMLISDANTQVTSIDGAIQLTGTGGAGTGTLNEGIVIQVAAQVNSTGTATIALDGTGGGSGGTSDQNDGIFFLQNAGVSAVTSTNGAIQITGTAGLGVNSFAINLGTNASQIESTGTANITLTGDSMNFDATSTGIDAGANVVTLQTKSAGNAINLGGADTVGTLGLTDAEIDRVNAGTLRIGRNDASASGTITLSSLIDLTAGANTVPTLHLVTGANVVDGTAGEQTDLKVASLAIEATSGIGSGDDLNVAVTNLAAANSGAAAPGNIQISNTGAMTIQSGPGVDGIVGVTLPAGAIAGNIVLVAASPLTINAPVTDNTGGNITLTAGAANSSNAADVLTINANIIATGGNGSINLNGNSLVVNSATATVVGIGSVTANFGGTGGTATFNTGSQVAAVNNDVTINTNAAITLNGSATLQVSGTGNVVLEADDLAVAATAAISADDGVANGNNLVVIRNFNAGRPIDLGSNTAGTLGLTEPELDRIRAETLRIGRNDAAASGTITLSAPVDLTMASTTGGFTVQALHLITGADAVETGTGALTVTSFAVEAGANIALGTNAGDVVNFAAASTAGSVEYRDTNGLSVGSVDGVAGVTASGTVQLTAGGDFTLPAGQAVQATGSVTLAGGAGGGGAVIIIRGAVTGSAVDVNGGTGSDTFDVTPGATAVLNIHGDLPAPPASPGDTLNVDTAGTTNPVVTAVSTPTGLQGSWTFGNRQNINFDTVETLLPTSDIEVSQTAPGSGVEGSPITYTITVMNNGPTDDPSLTVTDTLPAGSMFVTATASQGTFMVSGGVVTFDVGALASGASATLTVTVTPVEEGPLANTASATASGNPDVFSGNDSSTATVTVAEPPISSTGAAVAGFELTPLVNVPVATFSHANGVEPPDHFSATINWGDGTTSAGTVVRAGAGYQVLGSHTYTDEGAFALSVSVTDDGAAAVFPGVADIREELLPGGIRGTHGQRGVNEIFRDLFGIPASPASLVTLGAALDRGVPAFGVVQNLLRVPSLQTLLRVKLTADLLRLTLGAPPSPAALFAAVNFLRRHNFVQLTQVLTGLSKGGAQAKFIEVLYRAYLGRFPEAAGLGTWVRELRRGISEENVVAGIMGSAEFYNKTAP
jgi:Domain of unknown function DUF11/Domain of unknown function (DUF4214)